MILRVAIVAGTLLLALVAGLLAADSIPYAAPATSFDEVFGRYERLAVWMALGGIAVGVAAASRVGHRTQDLGTRWGLSVGAGLITLALLGAALLLL